MSIFCILIVSEPVEKYKLTPTKKGNNNLDQVISFDELTYSNCGYIMVLEPAIYKEKVKTSTTKTTTSTSKKGKIVFHRC